MPLKPYISFGPVYNAISSWQCVEMCSCYGILIQSVFVCVCGGGGCNVLRYFIKLDISNYVVIGMYSCIKNATALPWYQMHMVYYIYWVFSKSIITRLVCYCSCWFIMMIIYWYLNTLLHYTNDGTARIAICAMPTVDSLRLTPFSDIIGKTITTIPFISLKTLTCPYTHIL
jgi:hypothetical protein